MYFNIFLGDQKAVATIAKPLILLCIAIVTIVPFFAGTCDLESLVASGHKRIWRPPAANMGFCDFKDVVAFGNNQLWRPLAAKVQGLHSGLPKKMVSLPFINVHTAFFESLLYMKP